MMASKCSRIILNRASIASIKSAIKPKPSGTMSFAKSSIPTKPSVSRFTFSRVPSELGGVQSMLPLHSVVATARMTSCLSTTSERCAALLQEMGLSAPR